MAKALAKLAKTRKAGRKRRAPSEPVIESQADLDRLFGGMRAVPITSLLASLVARALYRVEPIGPPQKPSWYSNRGSPSETLLNGLRSMSGESLAVIADMAEREELAAFATALRMLARLEPDRDRKK